MAIPNRGPELIGVNIAFLATAIIANLLRCFVRVRMVKAFGVDDWLMVGATVSDTEHLALLHTLKIHSSFSLDTVFHRT
jgi:hypothetical protein